MRTKKTMRRPAKPRGKKVELNSHVQSTAIDLKDDILVSTSEAARLTGRSAKTLRQLRCDRQGPPCLKLGRAAQARVVYRRSDLEQWVSSMAQPAGGKAKAGVK